MDKNYDHKKYEGEIYKKWETSGAFKPQGIGKPFSIIMPPPNANDNLHIGHARFVTIEDALVRFNRMKGCSTLWLPGADHAGIETQFVFEKKLKEQGKSRFDYDNETLYQLIWDYVQKNKLSMENQLRVLGASCDWSRNKFTLDPEIVKIVYQTFEKLYSDGLIYKGRALINYCTRCGTGYSDLEVDKTEKESEMYTLDYGLLKIATTRPETIFADAAIAVNPKDKRYKNLIGKKAIIPILDKEIPIIADELVDINFGTGALKVTPAHDFTDFEISKKHELEQITIIGYDGKMNNLVPKKYAGLYVNLARKAVVEDLLSINKLIERKMHKQISGTCYRCKTQIEPLLSHQWFLKVAPLVKMAINAVKKKETKFNAKKFEKIYMHWLSNLRDWNISRQIVWGIRIPIWYCVQCNSTLVSDQKPATCNCGSKDFDKETDTFDTWFSSGQWPFATLQTTEPGDFDCFYPTSVMNTGYDILPFWIMRMMMLGTYITGKVPFSAAVLHGLVRDKQGQKISKSKGNVIDPLIMTEQYGADALRMALIWGSRLENDISLSEDNVKGMRNFSNKLWNIARYVEGIKTSAATKINSDDKQIVSDLKELTKEATKHLEKYQFGMATEKLYEFVWHKFADVYIEKTKDRKEEAYSTLIYVLETCLKLLHPFMPFVTEAIWQELGHSDLLITASWPSVKTK